MDTIDRSLTVVPGRRPGNAFYFLGVDPAPAQGRKADDFALSALRVSPKPGIETPTASLGDWVAEYVWAYVLRKARIGEASGFIHQKHRHFGFSGILMDPQGGGQWLELELCKGRQTIAGVETEVLPIASLENITAPNAQFLLCMYRRSDPGIQMLWQHLAGDDKLYEAMHVAFQEALEYALVSFAKPYNQRPKEATEGWTEEQKHALRNLDGGRTQLQNIQVGTREDGNWDLTRNGARRFSANGRKDIAYSMIFAYVRFLIWLKMGEVDMLGEGEDRGEYQAM